MEPNQNRRDFIRASALGTATILGAAGPNLTAADPEEKRSHHEHDHQHPMPDGEFPPPPSERPGTGGAFGSKSDRGKLISGFRSASDPPVPVEMPDLEKLPWKLVDGVKEFHLVAEHVRREILPGMEFKFWAYNGSMPRPMIEAVEGDRVRIIVHNKLPEPTTVHWHGLELPNAMDGVEGLTQDPIPAGGEFVYEFDLHQNGTFFYHSHDGMQEVMGMLGLFVIHPKQAHEYDLRVITNIDSVSTPACEVGRNANLVPRRVRTSNTLTKWRNVFGQTSTARSFYSECAPVTRRNTAARR